MSESLGRRTDETLVIVTHQMRLAPKKDRARIAMFWLCILSLVNVHKKRGYDESQGLLPFEFHGMIRSQVVQKAAEKFPMKSCDIYFVFKSVPDCLASAGPLSSNISTWFRLGLDKEESSMFAIVYHFFLQQEVYSYIRVSARRQKMEARRDDEEVCVWERYGGGEIAQPDPDGRPAGIVPVVEPAVARVRSVHFSCRRASARAALVGIGRGLEYGSRVSAGKRNHPQTAVVPTRDAHCAAHAIARSAKCTKQVFIAHTGELTRVQR
ncbi:hypothetical protein HPP92_010084 [Vanilla planifolia]|uniref:Uncharacterized protein n=1 Tax=Vanilla planifolia TaxID=51239 RepID=A0A835QTL9_VANPL|nr:hypothetical protein HPP92_010279 [Vanilla planifolia]KAG0482000.1 hypothetical protein HPP92_010084 [Vanilla planifolia]